MSKKRWQLDTEKLSCVIVQKIVLLKNVCVRQDLVSLKMTRVMF